MLAQGRFNFVFNTHMPYVLDPRADHPAAEGWLYEAMAECYLPLIEVFTRLVREGVPYKVTLSFTPCLLAMLADARTQAGFAAYLADHIRLCAAETRRLSADPARRGLAAHWEANYHHLLAYFDETLGRDIPRALKALADSGCVDLLASAGTHPYMPLWEMYPELLKLQIRAGVTVYRSLFEREPRGFWLPECGFYPGLDDLLAGSAVKYTYLDAHGLLNGFPRPSRGVHAPVHCPAGVAAFGRDWASHDQVWLKDRGYPGDPLYLNYDRDLAGELPVAALAPYTHQNFQVRTGINYYRQGWVDGSDIYNPEQARARCAVHAVHFVDRVCQQVRELSGQIDRPPVLVAMFDTEHFGHWWREGPVWLDQVLRHFAADQQTVQLATGWDYLTEFPTNPVVMPSLSSWGYQGYSETWLMGRNHWIYPALYEAADRLAGLIAAFGVDDPDIRAALNQYLRELLVAQSSDWAFMLHQETTMDYAAHRVQDALANMAQIAAYIQTGGQAESGLPPAGCQNLIFAGLDLIGLYLSG